MPYSLEMLNSLSQVLLLLGSMMSTVDGLMNPVVKIDSRHTVLEAAGLMKGTSRRSLIVMEGNIAAGIVTEWDLITKVVAEELPYSTLISRVMSTPLIVVQADTSIKEAARIMLERKIRRLPVVGGGELLGIVVASDLLQRLSRKTLTEEIWDSLTGSPL